MKTIFKRPPIISYKRDKSLNWRHAYKSKNWCKLRQLILRHNHKTTLGACASLSLTSSVLNWKNQNSTSVTKDLKNRFIFYCQKKKRKPDAKKRKNQKPLTDSNLQKPKNRPKRWPKPKIPTRPSPNSNPWPCLLITSWFMHAVVGVRKKISKWVKDHRFLADQFVSIVQDCPKDKDQ